MNIITLYISMFVSALFQGEDKRVQALHNAQEILKPYLEPGQAYCPEATIVAANDSMFLVKLIVDDAAPDNKHFFVVLKISGKEISYFPDKAVYEYIYNEPGTYALKRFMKLNGWPLR